ncbi:MAG: hypothetical protein LBI03_02665 [Clostridiales bacterium]|jgi:hypothetical protein|nr:hypothetical protein [Clostridiales bacterium]
MKALILGLVVIAAAVMAILPIGLGWGEDVMVFLRGALPVIAGFIGVIMIFVGITAIKDRLDAKKENGQNDDK